MNNKEIKNFLRKDRIEKRKEPFPEREKFNNLILNSFLKKFEKELKSANTIMSYMDFKGEVSTKELNQKLIEMGKTVLVPKVSEDKSRIISMALTENLEKGNFGILEPLGEEFTGKIDFIIVPGVVFNSRGDRIGFGKGYYDKFFADRTEKIKTENFLKVSLAYDMQIDESFHGEEHDEKIDVIITEKRVIDTRNLDNRL